jgi:acetone carboxylase gamma subunit
MSRQLTESLDIELIEGKHVIRCIKCKHTFCRVTENYKNHVPIREYPLSRSGPSRMAGGRFILREFYCPGCGLMLDTEVTTGETAPIWDIQLKEFGIGNIGDVR